MPTESEFLCAADIFDRASRSVLQVPSSLHHAFGSHVATGGQLTLDLDSLLMNTQVQCNTDGEELASLAQLCREKAALVGAYAAALGIYNAEMQHYEWAADRWQRNQWDYQVNPGSYGHPGPPPSLPVRPQKPAQWVEL